ncbi:TIGR03086 family metal-binding protein [Oerskovia flava]|uniref:TIGR03086 family metal-binding protein n=1 Tax=Oerskovia flava TaxID=2986422 RepID=UPI002240C0FF|nr:TIGR03086 family metal-binding protein [Oerskovia sp. JB1-3-2]
MDLLAAHGDAIGAFDHPVRTITDDQWDLPTPDDGWSVRDLVRHLTAEQLWVPELLAGRTTGEVGDVFDGDVLGEDPVDRWIDASVVSREAFLEPGVLDRTVHLSYGDVRAAHYCAEMTFDLTVHAWDLRRALGRPDDDLGAELVGWALGHAQARADDLARSHLFADPLPVPDGADDLTRLLALSGRAR